MTLSTIPYTFILKDKPENAPSVAASTASDFKNEKGFCATVYEALSNKNFIILLLIFSFMQGMFVSFGSNINVLLQPPFGVS